MRKLLDALESNLLLLLLILAMIILAILISIELIQHIEAPILNWMRERGIIEQMHEL